MSVLSISFWTYRSRARLENAVSCEMSHIKAEERMAITDRVDDWCSESEKTWSSNLVQRLRRRNRVEVSFHLSETLTGHGCLNQRLYEFKGSSRPGVMRVLKMDKRKTPVSEAPSPTRKAEDLLTYGPKKSQLRKSNCGWCAAKICQFFRRSSCSHVAVGALREKKNKRPRSREDGLCRVRNPFRTY